MAKQSSTDFTEVPTVNGSPIGGGEYTTIYSVNSGSASTTAYDTSVLNFSVGSYTQIVLDALVRPWGGGAGGGTDVWYLKFNNTTGDYNSYIHTSYSSDNSYTGSGIMRLHRVAGVDLLKLHVEIDLSNTYNAVTGFANEGWNGSTMRESWVSGSWRPSTPVAVTSVIFTTQFGDPIGVGPYSSIIVKGK